MELKSKSEAMSGVCQAKTCSAITAALANGTTFFSKKSGEIELCEDHLFEAQDMAKEMGQELVWTEYRKAIVVPAPVTETALIPAEKVKQDLAQEATQAEQALEQITAFTIINKEDLEFAAEVLADTKQSIKRLDEKRKEITDPLNKGLKAANALFQPAIKFYEQCERILKTKIGDAYKRAEDAARIALEQAGTAAETGDSGALTTALEGHDAAVQFPQTDGIQYRSKWKFEITNEALIPREYMTPNVRMIEGVIMQKKGATEIPGIRVFEDKIVASVS